MTPDETRPPREVVATAQYARSARALPRFADAVIDPEVHAVVRSCSASLASALAAAIARSASSVRCSSGLTP